MFEELKNKYILSVKKNISLIDYREVNNSIKEFNFLNFITNDGRLNITFLNDPHETHKVGIENFEELKKIENQLILDIKEEIINFNKDDSSIENKITLITEKEEINFILKSSLDEKTIFEKSKESIRFWSEFEELEEII